MTQVIGLFSDSLAVEQVVRALVAHDIDDDAYRVVEGPITDVTAVDVVPVPPSGSAGGAAIAPGWGGLDVDDETADYFRRSVEDGATLVVADVDDEKVAEIRHVFEENGGRVAAE